MREKVRDSEKQQCGCVVCMHHPSDARPFESTHCQSPPGIQGTAHRTQVVIDQNVLTRAAELTMPEASAIADNTLEATVRSLLSALHAPQILKVHLDYLTHISQRWLSVAR
eukprot:366226-Chlamydomonas_euryale.AAC.11